MLLLNWKPTLSLLILFSAVLVGTSCTTVDDSATTGIDPFYKGPAQYQQDVMNQQINSLTPRRPVTGGRLR